MLSPEKSQRLRAFLATLPDSIAARLADAVARDRASGGRGLPHDLILDALRATHVSAGDLERARADFLSALPMQRAGIFAGGPRFADFTQVLDRERAERGLGAARLLAATSSHGLAQRQARDEAMAHLKRYNDDIVRELRTAQGPRRALVEHRLELAAELTALLFGAAEAEALRRRAASAA